MLSINQLKKGGNLKIRLIKMETIESASHLQIYDKQHNAVALDCFKVVNRQPVENGVKLSYADYFGNKTSLVIPVAEMRRSHCVVNGIHLWSTWSDARIDMLEILKDNPEATSVRNWYRKILKRTGYLN